MLQDLCDFLVHATTEDGKQPVIINDPNLKAEPVVLGLDYPTTMAFLGPDDILVLEKDKGTVQRVVNGNMLAKPILDVNVNSTGENGLLGIAIQKSNGYNRYVFLYFSESVSDGENKMVANRLYRYEFVNNSLINPKLLLDLPPSKFGLGSLHNGGKIVVGPDENLYVAVGDLGRSKDDTQTQAQNNETGPPPDGSGGILRITQDGEPVDGGRGILGDEYPLNLYYAYGIRNSFGLDFDPVTGYLWDTENGDDHRIGDEINLVRPGFNSGWRYVEGMAQLNEEFDIHDLVDFNGKGSYSDPEFVFCCDYFAIGPTAIKFLDSDRYGEGYEYDMLVADFNNGIVYHFDLDEERTELDLTGSLSDKIASEDDSSMEDIKFVQAPGGVIDLQIGPDGFIYIVSVDVTLSDCDEDAPGCLVRDGIKGSIYRIVPISES